jgi:DNA-binding phage protein
LVVPGKPITLKQEVAEFLASNNVGSRAFVLDDKDVVLLLRAIIKRQKSISAFSRRHGLELSQLNKMLNGRRPVSRVVVKALGLRAWATRVPPSESARTLF